MNELYDFFNASGPIELVYWAMAILGTGFLALRSILSILGVDFDHEADIDLDLDAGGDDVSLSAIAAFMIVAGWTGVIGYRSTNIRPGQLRL